MQATYTTIRHGARMDAADPQWHLTSPTPYDPPLTYGGWRQSQVLGARIANIVQNREATLLDHHSHGDPSDRHARHARSRRRKHKVVIHSSPFLRCVQTSVAVSAGMSQYEVSTSPNSPNRPYTMHSGSPILRARDQYGTQNLSAIPEPEENGIRKSRNISPSSKPDARTILRVDAFLGEWLSPDYFENITPPPGSKMMVASAKADLLRRGDPIDATKQAGSSPPRQGNFPGGWRSDANEPEKAPNAVDEGSLSDLSGLSHQLPKLSRANTFNSGKRSDSRTGPKSGLKGTEQTLHYMPPTPSYAISPSEPIPQGYVAHARDACVNVDYQWDSLRPPLEWGSGGEYGEEWSSMHKRFRKGLHEMLSWYRNHDPSQRPEEVGCQSPALTNADTNSLENLDEDTDIILVLITHGAGCNALIGALTNQPVLIDVGMASLTMAVRKNIDYTRLEFQDGSLHSPMPRPRSSMDVRDSEEYDMKLIASTDHLRPGSRFLQEPQRGRSPSMPNREKSPYRYERHVVTHHQHHPPSSPLQDTFSIDSNGSPPSPNLEPIKRTITTNVPSSGGLWTPPTPKAAEETQAPSKTKDPSQLQGPTPAPNGASKVRPKSLHIPDSSVAPERPKDFQSDNSTGRSLAQSGLWGAPPQALATERERGAKRRWTLSQAG